MSPAQQIASISLEGLARDLLAALDRVAAASLASGIIASSGLAHTPAQAIEVYKESIQQLKVRIEQWVQFKQTTLIQLNQKLRQANIQPIAIGSN